mgnify:FL=1
MNDLLKLIATTEVEGAEGTVDTLQDVVEPTGAEGTETVVETEEEVQDNIPTEYEIDGEKFTIDEIREWRKGNMRQADYTRKTTELAKQRKEAEEALEIYNYLMSRQDLVAKLYELDTENPVEVKKVQEKLDPVAKQVQELNQKLLIKDIESELKDITSKDKTVTDVELLEIANEMKCPINIAYDVWKGRNMDKVLKQKELELKRQLAEDIKKNKDTTKTLITSADTKNDKGTFGLSEQQLLFADKLGMTPEEYAKYSKNPW